MEAFKTICSVYLLLLDDSKILLSKRANTGYEDGNYSLVAGHLEQGESLRSAMAREAAEEIGLQLSANDLELALVMHRFAATSNPPERMDFFFRINNWQGEPVNKEPMKCSDLKWSELQDLPANIIPYIKHALEQIALGIKYCQYGWSDKRI